MKILFVNGISSNSKLPFINLIINGKIFVANDTGEVIFKVCGSQTVNIQILEDKKYCVKSFENNVQVYQGFNIRILTLIPKAGVYITKNPNYYILLND